jgi:Mrp family chromosome partitioning ATPase
VLVVDGDAASPTLDGQLGLTRSPGLTDVLSGRSQLPETVHHPDESSQVSVLTVGANAGARRWTSNDLTRLFSYSRKARRFDGVVVSLTSAAMPDGVALGMELGLHQAVVLAVDPTRTKRRQLGELIHAFGGPDEVCGLLLVTNETAAVEMRRLARRWGSASSVMDRGLESETSPEELS